MSSYAHGEGTEVIEDPQRVLAVSAQLALNARVGVDTVNKVDMPAVIMASEPYVKLIADMATRGLRLRCITEITKENIEACKKYAKYYEMRHVDGVRANFSVSDTEYLGAPSDGDASLTYSTYSNAKGIVRQTQYMFKILWDRAIPAEQKIREIEQGIAVPRTEVIHGLENSMPYINNFWNNARKTVDIASDSSWPTYAITYEPFHKIVVGAHGRNIRIRVITDVTRDNVQHCKQVMQYCELYHSERLKSNLAVNDSEYLSWSNVKDIQNVAFVRSNEPEIVQQQTFLFEALLKKAIPAQLKIKEIEGGIEPEKTEFFYEAEVTTIEAVSFFARIRKRYDVVVDTNAASVVIEFEPIKNAYVSMKERGVKIRWATEITKDNVKYCKEVMNSLGVEIRHLDGIKGNFGISESEYIAAATLEEAKPIPILMTSTVKTFREQQEYMFDTLWNKGILAEQRIREIEEGIPSERTEVMSDPHAIKSLYQNTVREAREDILLILPTVNAFARQKRMGILDSLKRQQSEKGVKVRMLVPANENIDEQEVSDLEAHGIQVNLLSHTAPQKVAAQEEESKEKSTRVTVVIVDNKKSLVIELGNDEKENFVDAIGMAVLSTGKALASSYVRIFESLWQETKLTAKLAESDKLQKEFINVAAHELRTPITPILAALYLAENEKKSDGTSQTILSESGTGMIQRNAKRLEKLANDILTVSNIEARGLQLQKERGNLNSWISEELSTAKMFVPSGTKIDFVLKRGSKGSSSLLLIDADKSKIFEVLSNLIRNAIKFSQDDGKITIRTLRSRDGQSAIVEVHDTGRGIDPEIYPRLFQKFAASYDYGGTGLGLYISRVIIETHGGKIYGENNKDGKGATFTFTLPLARVRATVESSLA